MSIPPWQAAQCKLLDAAMKVAYIGRGWKIHEDSKSSWVHNAG